MAQKIRTHQIRAKKTFMAKNFQTKTDKRIKNDPGSKAFEVRVRK